MSIKQQVEINELRDRVEALERIVNKLNNEPRKVAGVPDPDPDPEPKPKQKKSQKKVEGNE